MRDIAQLPDGIPKQVDANFPFGAIINETVNVDGTPVVREIYNDVLVNLYKLLSITGNEANGTEDSEATTYQLLAAFQKLCNVQNDIEQVLSIVSTVAQVNLDIDLLPDKYFLFAKASAAYNPGLTYTFQGTGSITYPFSSPGGFAAGDELLIILNQSGVIAYSLTTANAVTRDEIFTVFGTPLAYNDSDKIWYQSEGFLFADTPESYDLQSAIRTLSGIGTLVVYEMLIIGNFILCLTYDSADNAYRFYKFDLQNITSGPSLVTMSGPDFPGAVGYDDQPFVFTDGTKLYITNNSDGSPDDFDINIYTFDLAAGTITGIGSIALDDRYKKSTNTVIVGNYLYTYIAGATEQYNLTTGVYSFGKSFPSLIGVMFNHAGKIYYTNGDVAKKWTLPV